MLEMLKDSGDPEKFGDDCGGGDVNDDGGDDEKN